MATKMVTTWRVVATSVMVWIQKGVNLCSMSVELRRNRKIGKLWAIFQLVCTNRNKQTTSKHSPQFLVRISEKWPYHFPVIRNFRNFLSNGVSPCLSLLPLFDPLLKKTLLLDGHLHVVPVAEVSVLERVDSYCRLAGFVKAEECRALLQSSQVYHIL